MIMSSRGACRGDLSGLEDHPCPAYHLEPLPPWFKGPGATTFPGSIDGLPGRLLAESRQHDSDSETIHRMPAVDIWPCAIYDGMVLYIAHRVYCTKNGMQILVFET